MRTPVLWGASFFAIATGITATIILIVQLILADQSGGWITVGDPNLLFRRAEIIILIAAAVAFILPFKCLVDQITDVHRGERV
jgi:hypothetical protein